MKYKLSYSGKRQSSIGHSNDIVELQLHVLDFVAQSLGYRSLNIKKYISTSLPLHQNLGFADETTQVDVDRGHLAALQVEFAEAEDLENDKMCEIKADYESQRI